MAAGKKLGLAIAGFPLSEVRPRNWKLPELGGIDAVLAGSANAFRHGGPQLQALIHRPVLAVGMATAEAAVTAGFRVAGTGTGGLQALLDEIGPRYSHLLRLAGEDHVPIDLPAGTELTSRVIYGMENIAISREFFECLRESAIVLLHSAAAAAHFAAECDRLGIERSRITLAAIGPRVLEVVGAGWHDAVAAKTPSDAELLALVKDMCQ
ncbi:MAG: uroporphyrinogen-III synthase [Erythrobacter sp.]